MVPKTGQLRHANSSTPHTNCEWNEKRRERATYPQTRSRPITPAADKCFKMLSKNYRSGRMCCTPDNSRHTGSEGSSRSLDTMDVNTARRQDGKDDQGPILNTFSQITKVLNPNPDFIHGHRSPNDNALAVFQALSHFP